LTATDPSTPTATPKTPPSQPDLPHILPDHARYGALASGA
jgi:hypothetical protein